MIHTQRTTGKHSQTLNYLTSIRNIETLPRRDAVDLDATVDLFIKNDQELAKTISEHRIAGNWLSIIKSNCTIRKCQKSKILQEIHVESVDYSKYIAIVDMGLLSGLSTPSSADRENGDWTVYTWKDYEDKVSKQYLEGILQLL